MSQTQVFIFDTTLRDGEQAPGFSLRPAEKLQIARQLDRLGVDAIEAGFAISSPAEAEAIRRIATEVRRAGRRLVPVTALRTRTHRDHSTHVPVFSDDHPFFRLVGAGRGGGKTPGARDKHAILDG